MESENNTEEKFPVTTSIWSDSIENMIKNIGDSCKGYKWMNLFASKKASTKHSVLMYIVIGLGPLSGLLTAFSEQQELVTVLVTLLSFLSGTLSAITKFGKFERKSVTHKSIAVKYASLEGNIRRQLSLSREERVNAGEYVNWVTSAYDELFSSTPLIPDDIYQEWVSYAKQNNITLPRDLSISLDKSDKNTYDIQSPTHYTVEMGKYDEGKMKYELARLSNFSQK
jgi:hypothetical protein